MAHEELKAQYEEDRKNHERPWELWEYRKKSGIYFTDWSPLPGYPEWNSEFEYRRIEWVLVSSDHDFEKGIFSGEFKRKETPFVPEYFSGLNWQDAEKLVGKVVEFSDNGEYWTEPMVLDKLRYRKAENTTTIVSRFVSPKSWWYFIRTTPETFQRPTITIAGGWKLPRPEVEALEKNTHYFFLRENTEIHSAVWWGTSGDYARLRDRRIHLTEDRAQAWADWWVDTVIKAVHP